MLVIGPNKRIMSRQVFRNPAQAYCASELIQDRRNTFTNLLTLAALWPDPLRGVTTPEALCEGGGNVSKISLVPLDHRHLTMLAPNHARNMVPQVHYPDNPLLNRRVPGQNKQ